MSIRDTDPNSPHADPFPWSAIAIIALAMVVVGWAVMTAGAVNATILQRPPVVPFTMAQP
jgi:hypothetical protein